MPKKAEDLRPTARLIARALHAEKGIKSALIAGGISEAQATKGWAVLQRERKKLGAMVTEEYAKLKGGAAPAAVAELRDDMDAMVAFGRELLSKPKEAEALIAARLAKNAVLGVDGGAQSAKILGSHKTLRLWEPDILVGVQINAAPKGFEDVLGEYDLDANGTSSTSTGPTNGSDSLDADELSPALLVG